MRRLVLALFLLVLAVNAWAQAPGSSLRGTVLVSAAKLDGSVFARSVILVVQNDAHGSIGVAVNRRVDTTLAEVLPHEIDNAGNYPVYAGGPVGPQWLTMLVHGDDVPADADTIAPGVAFVAEAGAFDAVIGQGHDPAQVRVIDGYTGWAPGQLEAEIENGAWHIVPADPDIVFSEAPDTLWQRLIERVGGESEAPDQRL